MFRLNPLYRTDGYKVGHKAMLAPGTTKLYGTWIPRSTKHAPKGITKIVSFGHQLTWKHIHDIFEEYFFHTYWRNNSVIEKLKQESLQFAKDMSLYLGMEYNGKHFEELWELGYLPLRVKALPEGIETDTIYKDPITDDGTKKSLKGLLCIQKMVSINSEDGSINNSKIKETFYTVKQECTPEEESQGLLQVIYENGVLYNQITLEEVRKKLLS